MNSSAVLPKIPSFRLDGRRALVTGGGGGIGLAAAAALAEAGASVTIAGRTAEPLEALAKAIANAGAAAEPVTIDVTNLKAVDEFFAERPAFDVLVNNAGTNRPMPMLAVEEADFDAVMNLNVKAAFFVAQGFAKALLRAKSPGSMVHIGSQMGHVGGVNRSLYCASKWALEGMSKAFALDLAGQGIRSNTIAPTFIETPLTRPFFDDAAFRESVIAKIKLGRLGQVEDVMGAILYLASDASSLVTGTSLLVDGGWTAD